MANKNQDPIAKDAEVLKNDEADVKQPEIEVSPEGQKLADTIAEQVKKAVENDIYDLKSSSFGPQPHLRRHALERESASETRYMTRVSGELSGLTDEIQEKIDSDPSFERDDYVEEYSTARHGKELIDSGYEIDEESGKANSKNELRVHLEVMLGVNEEDDSEALEGTMRITVVGVVHSKRTVEVPDEGGDTKTKVVESDAEPIPIATISIDPAVNEGKPVFVAGEYPDLGVDEDEEEDEPKVTVALKPGDVIENPKTRQGAATLRALEAADIFTLQEARDLYNQSQE